MRRALFLAFFLVISALTATGQAVGNDPTQFVPRFEVAGGYQYIYANAPPGQPNSFSLNGGFVEADVPLRFWLSVAGEASFTRASSISTLGQNLFLTTYTAGPRITFRKARTVTYAQGTVGAAHGSDSYFPNGNSYSTSANSLAFTVGGGFDYQLSHRLAIRLPEVQYLHTAFPNGVNSTQNQVMVGAGIVFKFHGHYAEPVVAPAPEPVKKKVSITCSVNSRSVMPGDQLEVTALSRSDDNLGEITYSWTSDGGVVSGTGSMVSIDTTGVAPGNYRIHGHASVAGGDSMGGSCEVPFRVVEAPKAMAPPPPPPAPAPMPPAANDQEFHAHVRDVLFDYDKSDLRADSAPSMAEAVNYLQSHPEIRVLIGGYSDERGTTEYNIALGLRRATTVRDALVSAGISPARIEVISYGKGAQVCTEADEACFQRNRRAAFLIEP